MLERFVKDARNVAGRAAEVARERGSAAVEAEHLLLALAEDRGAAGAVLAGAGLDRPALDDALEAELQRSLQAVGVALSARELPLPRAHGPSPRFAASAKRALEGSLEAAKARGDRRITPPHILLAVLAAREGTVPRALRGAGVDPEALARDTHAALDARRAA